MSVAVRQITYRPGVVAGAGLRMRTLDIHLNTRTVRFSSHTMRYSMGLFAKLFGFFRHGNQMGVALNPRMKDNAAKRGTVYVNCYTPLSDEKHTLNVHNVLDGVPPQQPVSRVNGPFDRTSNSPGTKGKMKTRHQPLAMRPF